jgi:hypothetical protein
MAINTTGMMVLSNGVTHLIAMAQYHMLSHGVTQLFFPWDRTMKADQHNPMAKTRHTTG